MDNLTGYKFAELRKLFLALVEAIRWLRPGVRIGVGPKVRGDDSAMGDCQWARRSVTLRSERVKKPITVQPLTMPSR